MRRGIAASAVVISLVATACASSDTSDLEDRVDELELRIAQLEGVSQPGGIESGAVSSSTLDAAVILTKRIHIEPNPGNTCSGRRPEYARLDEGARVEVTDGSGKTLTVAHLEVGEMVGTGDDWTCRMAFTAEIPTGESYYDFDIGGHRFEANKSDLYEAGWAIEVELD